MNLVKTSIPQTSRKTVGKITDKFGNYRKKIEQTVTLGSSYEVDLLEIGKKEVIIYGLLKEFQQETIVQVMISEVIKTSEIACMRVKGGYM